MLGYTNKDAIENYLLTIIAEWFEEQINEWIEAMENYINRYTDRVFIAKSSERIFDGNDKDEIFVDEFVKLIKLEIDGKEIDTENCLLYPANSLPKTRIKLINDIFTIGDQNIKITAQWGYSEECPKDIKFVCTVLVAGIINYSLSAEGEVKSESIGNYSVTFKDERQWQDFEQARAILESYRKITF